MTTSTHPITGRTTMTIAGEPRTMAFDMNAAAAFFAALGEHWTEWVVARFLGKRLSPEDKQLKVEVLTPQDIMLSLFALLATDREDSGRVETPATLARSISPAVMMDLQLAMLQCVLAGFGVPGEVIGAAGSAAGQPQANAAAGTGTKHFHSRSGKPGFRQKRSGA